MFHVHIVTLYPEIFPGPLSYSLAGRALRGNIWSLKTIQIRDFAEDKHRTVDDTPYGGGVGMVMRADIVAKALDQTPKEQQKVFLTPRGQPFCQEMAKKFAKTSGVTILCGHFEGIDARLVKSRDIEEISIGDYILSGGEIAAFPFLDSIIRLLPKVMGNEYSSVEESFEDGLLEHDAYTKPRIFEGQAVPEILLSGHHAKIAQFRQEQREALTKARRPDLYQKYLAQQAKSGKKVLE